MPPSPSPSGFASLRARFEQNSQDNETSPPSRGRSPAGSITSEQARPLSKIRTNFVAVEPSGHMSHNAEVTAAASTALDGSQESKIAKPAPNASANKAPFGVTGQETNKSVTETEDASKIRLVAGSTTNNATQDSSQGLGSILKGSPFEEDRSRDEIFDQAVQKQQGLQPGKAQEAADAPRSTQKTQAVKSSNPTKLGASVGPGKTRPTATQNSKPDTAGAVVKTSGRPKDVPADKAKVTSSSTTGQGTKPSKVSTKSAPKPTIPAPPAGAQVGEKPAKVDQNGGPNQKSTGALAEASSNPKDAPKSTTSKVSALAKSVSKPIKNALANPAPASKSRPRSPTRPARLPAAATAGTASSNAKHEEEAAPSRSPSRQSHAPTVSKTRIESLSKPKQVRASLPANSKPLVKAKPKPRASLAGGSAPSGSFLERMTRPTQSSAQKVHEKVEPPSPPRRNVGSGNHVIKPKRKSGGSSGEKSEEGQKEQSLATDMVAQSADAPVDLTPLPLTDGAAVQSNNVAQEIQNTAPAPEPVV